PQVRNLAEQFARASNVLYLGRGVNFPVALEGALKLKEISYIHAEGYPAAEMKHGPIALIDEHMPVVFVAPKDEVYGKVLSNMQEVKARRGRIIAITTEGNGDVSGLAEAQLRVPATLPLLSPVLTTIPLQLFAYHVAALREMARTSRPDWLVAESTVIRTRLDQGDFRVGDRVVVTVEDPAPVRAADRAGVKSEEQQLSDTFTVGAGQELLLPVVGTVSL